MSMIGVQLRPADTLFFGSGMPFSATGAQEDISGVFPPHPPTIVGALRGWLARSQGWSGRGPWPSELHAILGDIPVELGKLQFCGPFLMRDGAPLFKAPRHLLGIVEDERWTPKVTLRPGPATRCDLGDEIRLPTIPAADGGCLARLAVANDHWLTLAGLDAVLTGELPKGSEVVTSSELWREERRVGLERDPLTRTAREGMLYSTRHIRLMQGVGLGVRFVGIPSDWRLPFDQNILVGGESRIAQCLRWDNALSITRHHQAVAHNNKVSIIGLTPLDIEGGVCPGMTLMDEYGGVRVVSACIDRPLRIGGWSTLEHRPLPLRSVLAPGSVLFCEANDPKRLAAALKQSDGLLRVGMRQQWGFGLITLGTWTEDHKDKDKP